MKGGRYWNIICFYSEDKYHRKQFIYARLKKFLLIKIVELAETWKITKQKAAVDFLKMETNISVWKWWLFWCWLQITAKIKNNTLCFFLCVCVCVCSFSVVLNYCLETFCRTQYIHNFKKNACLLGFIDLFKKLFVVLYMCLFADIYSEGILIKKKYAYLAWNLLNLRRIFFKDTGPKFKALYFANFQNGQGTMIYSFKKNYNFSGILK